MRRMAAIGLRTGVALVFLLATSVPRFSLTHVHSERDDQHTHAHEHDHAHPHDHDAGPVGFGDRHTHVHWLCFEFQVPTDTDDSQYPLQKQSDWQIDLAVVAPITPVTVHLPAPLFPCDWSDFESHARSETVDANRWAHRPPDSSRLLLCDTARRECAGVLLV